MATYTGDWVKDFISSQSVVASDYAETAYDQAIQFLTDLSTLSDWQPDVNVGAISTDIAVNPLSVDRPTDLDTTLAVEQYSEAVDVEAVTVSDIREYDSMPDFVNVNDLGDAPTFSGDIPSFETISIDSAPVFTNPFDETVTIPTFDIEVPTISIPEIPDFTYPTDVGEVPELDDVETPVMRSLVLPDVPDVTVDIPELPEISIGEFNEDAPDMTITPPSNTFVYSEPSHESLRSEVIDAIAEVTEYSSDAEDATWARGRARLEITNERTYNEALAFWASRGWTLPTGALTGRLTEALAEQTRAEEQLNYELIIEADKINIDARKFKTTTLIQLEQVLTEYIGGVANRAYQSAVSAQEIGIKLYEASVAQYNTLLTKWRTSAEVYKTTVEASLIEIEKFKAQVESVKVSADIKGLLVSIYNGQVNVLKTYADMYRTEMEGAKIKSDISMSKLIAFKEKVNVYTAKMNAESVKYDAIKAKIAGESAKATLYNVQAGAYDSRVKGIVAELQAKATQVQGYVAEVQAYTAIASVEKTKADINTAKVQAYKAGVDVYLGKIEAYKAKGSVEAYKASVAGSNAQIMASRANINDAANRTKIQVGTLELENNKLVIEEYKTKLLAYSEWVKSKIAELGAKATVYNAKSNMYMGDVKEANIANEALIKVAEATIKSNTNATEVALKQAETELGAYLKYQEIRQDSMKEGANVSAQLAASAMTAINTTAGIGYSAGSTMSHQYSESEQVSESHSYKEKEICCTSGKVIE